MQDDGNRSHLLPGDHRQVGEVYGTKSLKIRINRMHIKRSKIHQIIKFLKEGQQLHASCQAAGISPSTLWYWSHKQQKFSKFYHLRLEVLISRAQDASEKRRNAIVESTFFKKLKEGTATAAEYIFYFCNRDPARWKNVKDTLIQLQQSSHLHIDDLKSKALTEMKDNELDSVLDGIINRRRTSVSS